MFGIMYSVHNLVNPDYAYIDATRFSVQQFYRARNDVWVEKLWSFVEDENGKMGGNPPSRPVKRNYEIQLVYDVVDNIPGATQRLLDQIKNECPATIWR